MDFPCPYLLVAFAVAPAIIDHDGIYQRDPMLSKAVTPLSPAAFDGTVPRLVNCRKSGIGTPFTYQWQLSERVRCA